ncbi:MAG: hypothetical protein CUN53_14000, partial [Phototrophicales bacterium]
MTNAAFLARLARRLNFLTRPSPHLKSSLDRQQARLLASLSLSLLLIEAVSSPIWILTMPSFFSAPLISFG